MKEEILVDYFEGRLPANRCREVEKHLADDDGFLEELVLFGEMDRADNLTGFANVPADLTARTVGRVHQIQEDAPKARLFEYIAAFLSSATNTLRDMFAWRSAGLSPVRGTKTVIDENLIVLTKSFSELDIEIELDKIRSRTVSIKVTLLNTLDSAALARATLIRKDREVSSFLIRGARVLFDNIPFGIYRLVISIDGDEKGRYDFEIKESRHGR